MYSNGFMRIFYDSCKKDDKSLMPPPEITKNRMLRDLGPFGLGPSL